MADPQEAAAQIPPPEEIPATETHPEEPEPEVEEEEDDAEEEEEVDEAEAEEEEEEIEEAEPVEETAPPATIKEEKQEPVASGPTDVSDVLKAVMSTGMHAMAALSAAQWTEALVAQAGLPDLVSAVARMTEAAEKLVGCSRRLVSEAAEAAGVDHPRVAKRRRFGRDYGRPY